MRPVSTAPMLTTRALPACGTGVGAGRAPATARPAAPLAVEEFLLMGERHPEQVVGRDRVVLHVTIVRFGRGPAHREIDVFASGGHP